MLTFGGFLGERRRLADAVKHHTRDRNRLPSEPAGKFWICGG